MPNYQLSITFQDAFTRKTTRGFDIVSANFADAKATAAGLVNDYGDVTDMRILKYSVGEEVPIVDLVTAGANVDRGLTINWELLPLVGKEAVTKVPSPPIDLFDSEGRLELTDARVTAFVANFLGGEIRVSDGEQVGAILKGRLDK